MKSQLAIIFSFFSNICSHPVKDDNPSRSFFYKHYPYSFSVLEKRFRTRTRKEESTVTLKVVKNKSRDRKEESTVNVAPSSYPTFSV